MNKREMERAVKRGAKLLDNKMPDWHKKINLNVLKMNVGVQHYATDCGCIGAQLAFANKDVVKGWISTMMKLFGALDYTKAVKFGFVPQEFLIARPYSPEPWEYLTKLW